MEKAMEKVVEEAVEVEVIKINFQLKKYKK
jgi:hypothetical protein